MTETQFRMEDWDQISSSIKQPLLLCVAITGLITIVSTLFYFFSQPVIPLFYSLALPEKSLAVKEFIFIFPSLSLIITLLHSILISVFKDLEKLILRLFAWTTLVMQAFLFFTLLRIIIITY
jgi:hypothetical protein